MLADPQTVTVNAVAIPLPRVRMNPTENGYTSADGNTSLTTKQNVTASRFRREVRLSQKKVSTDPLSTTASEKGFSVYLVIDEPRVGFTDVEISYVVEALKGWLIAANYNRVLGGEF